MAKRVPVPSRGKLLRNPEQEANIRHPEVVEV